MSFEIGDMVRLRKGNVLGHILKVMKRTVGCWFSVGLDSGGKIVCSSEQIELINKKAEIANKQMEETDSGKSHIITSNPNINSARIKLSDGEVIYIKEHSGAGLLKFMFERIELGDTVKIKLSDDRVLRLNNRTTFHYKLLNRSEIIGALTILIANLEDDKNIEKGVITFRKCFGCREMVETEDITLELPEPDKELCLDCSVTFFSMFSKVCEKTVEVYNKFSQN